MNHHSRPHQYTAANHRAVAYGDAVEWEELPSLADSLAQRLLNLGPHRPNASAAVTPPPVLGCAWDHTLPATLDTLPRSEPFRETLQGLVTREVNEPEVFRHFFGPNAKG